MGNMCVTYHGPEMPLNFSYILIHLIYVCSSAIRLVLFSSDKMTGKKGKQIFQVSQANLGGAMTECRKPTLSLNT